MTATLNPYLRFPGTARQAIAFYGQVFGGAVSVSTFGDAGVPGVPADQVMHASVETPVGAIMASDLPPGTEVRRGSDVALSLSGDDGDLLRRWWDGLREGGTVEVALERQMWGDDFGMCTDRFGIAWMVNIAGTPA